MADYHKRLPENVEGDFYVDETCINCGTCRLLAPEVFGDLGTYAFVHAQPEGDENRRHAYQALVSCPTSSIGSRAGGAQEALGDFPLEIEDDVYYCGFASAKSYGASSYFIKHPDGNWLIDSPRLQPTLIEKFEKLGGLRYIFLTHRDDVADAGRYAQYFKAERIIHEADSSAAPGAERLLRGREATKLGGAFTLIPVPGHTEGHAVLLYKEKFLFTGDHLEWDIDEKTLGAYRDFCWYDWKEQTRSMERLETYRFEWVLPGHGHRIKLPADEMHTHLTNLVDRMRRQP